MSEVAPSICHRDLMLATAAKSPFSQRGWIFELKYDGFRCLVTKRGGEVRLESRSGRNMAQAFPELVDEIRPSRDEFVLDCELVILDERGCPQWDRLHRRHAISDALRARRAAARDPAALFAFDLLWLNGADFRLRSLLERKATLRRLIPGNRRVLYAAHLNDDCSSLWQLALEMELEGIVAKHGASRYEPGRSDQWRKIKTAAGAEREHQRFPE